MSIRILNLLKDLQEQLNSLGMTFKLFFYEKGFNIFIKKQKFKLL